jgi:hypothetical protein
MLGHNDVHVDFRAWRGSRRAVHGEFQVDTGDTGLVSTRAIARRARSEEVTF